MSDISVHESENDRNVLVLTISKENFGEFIRDLISEKKKITRDIKGTFAFKREDVLDLISLIDQRVRLQNQVVLSTFNISIRYHDGYEQELESLESFKSFRDARQFESCGAACALSYVINFPGRSKPEKQEASFVIQNTKAFEEFQRTDVSESFSLFSILNLGLKETGLVRVNIEYTDISWGNDLENLISQYLFQKITKSNRLYSNLRALWLVGAPPLFILGILMYADHIYRAAIDLNKLHQVNLIDGNNAITIVEKLLQKMSLMISSSAVSLTSQQFQSIALEIIGLLVAFVAVSFSFAIRKPSFLIMNEFTKQLHEKHSRKYDLVRYGIIVTFVVGLFASLGASFLYDVIKP
jgi:hypothetical protein